MSPDKLVDQKTMSNISFAFFGTGDIAVGVLQELERAGFVPTHIVTSPDRPAGRGRVLTPPAAKQWALERSVPVFQPEKLDSDFLENMRMFFEELIIVADYGKIIPKSVLAIPKHGVLNVHPSLLPRLRGPSPIRSAILTGEKHTGVTIMQMDEEMDHGPIVAQKEVPIPDFPPRGRELDTLLSHEGGTVLAEVLPRWVAGAITPREQEHDKATYTKKLSKDDAEIILSDDAYNNFLKIRAFDDNPRPYFFAQRGDAQIRVVIADAHMKEDSLVLLRVIPEGKKEMTYEEFLRSGARPL